MRHRFLTIILPIVLALVVTPAKSDDRVDLIDTASNTGPYLAKLKSKGVRVIARYYARKYQSYLPHKRLAYNKVGKISEAAAIINNGLSILSVYQYRSNLRKKFVSGVDGSGGPVREAELDAKAALAQAKIVKQPKDTAIYFGVDFNLVETDTKAIKAVLKYFKKLNELVAGKYKIGVYGNGFAQRLLREKGLVQLSWISASVAFTETDEFYNSGNWTVFQNQIDRYWFGNSKCPSGLGLDTNLANPKSPDIGAWGNGYKPDIRTTEIFNSRKFSTTTAYVRTSGATASPKIAKKRCRLLSAKWKWLPDNFIPYARNGRVIVSTDQWLKVDLDDDGVFDGYTRRSLLTGSLEKMPRWEDRP